MAVETVQVPRPNPRLPGAETWAAERIRAERERRSWSTAELARRVTEVGCVLNQSAVWRIENATPRRTISLDEAIAFAQVLEIPLTDLIQPAVVIEADLMRLGTNYGEWRIRFLALAEELSKIAREGRRIELAANPGVAPADLPTNTDLRKLNTAFSDIQRRLAEIDEIAWAQIASLADSGQADGSR